MSDLIDKYIGESKKLKFLAAHVTHNNKFEVKMYSKNGLKGPFFMDIVDVKSNKKEEKEFSSSKEMKAYWNKIHTANLK